MVQITLEEFGKRVGEILPVIMRQGSRQMMGDFYKTKITLPQFIILEFLNRQGSSKMSDMAKALGVTTAAMTGIVARLVRDGYVSRDHDLKDRRIVRIMLKAKGTRLVRMMMEKRRQMIMKIFAKVSQKDREDYLRVLTNIRDVILAGKKSV